MHSFMLLLLNFSPRLVERERLDRRRLEAAHFKYAVLNVASWYPNDFTANVVFLPDMQQTLLNVTPMYQRAFHKVYSGICNNCVFMTKINRV